MKIKQVILVKTATCPYCPSASKMWNEIQQQHKFEYKEVDAMSEEGKKLVKKHAIMSVPTTIIDDKVAFVGMPNREKAVEAVR